MDITLKEVSPSYEWVVFKDKTFSVVVRCWFRTSALEEYTDEWVWNVYVNIFDNHPLFNQPKAVLSLPFHGGANFSEIIENKPAIKKYDWQKEYKLLKVGCDYAHYRDDFFMESDPKYGIPGIIKQDCSLLCEIMLEKKGD